MEQLMKLARIVLISVILFPVLAMCGEKEDLFFKEKLIPLAQEFVKRNGLSAANFGTNSIKKYKVEFFTDGRSGCTANVALKDGRWFYFISNGQDAEINYFHDETKTYYSLADAPKEKIDAVKVLNLRNKLSNTNALKLAEKFFKLQGHKDENFHPAELHQSYWSGGDEDRGGELPYYEVTWYRKDVTKEKRESGDSKELLKSVTIEVSGIDSHLISYSKGLLPIGKDFETDKSK